MTKLPSLLASLAVAALIAMGWAGSASALPFAMADVNYSVGGATGTISLVGGGQSTGTPAGGINLSGATAGTDDVLIFQVINTAGVLDEVGIGVFDPFPLLGVNSSGSGWIAGANFDVAAGITNTSSTRTFTFDGGSGLNGAATSDLFYVSFASLPDGRSVNFMLLSGEDVLTETSVVTVVPEPGTAMLFGLGLAGLAAARRNRR